MSKNLNISPVLLGKPVVTVRCGHYLGFVSDLLIAAIDGVEVLRGIVVGECHGISLVGKGFARRFHCRYDYIRWHDIVAISTDEIKVATTHVLRQSTDQFADRQWLQSSYQMMGCCSCSNFSYKSNPLPRNEMNPLLPLI